MGSGGTIDVNWLDQWANSASVTGDDDGLFCFLRDVPDLAASPIYAGGTGLLDRLAERQARAGMVDGSITSQVTMSPGLLSQVVSALAIGEAARRFDTMPLAAQVELRELYLAQRIGAFTVSYPTSSSPETVFYGLINMQLSDIEFTLHIDYTHPVTSLDADNNAIRMHLALPAVRGNARTWGAGRPAITSWP